MEEWKTSGGCTLLTFGGMLKILQTTPRSWRTKKKETEHEIEEGLGFRGLALGMS